MTDPVPDTLFSEVKLPSYLRWKASPEIPYEDRGILIAAPRQVVVSPRMRLPVCASAIVDDREVSYHLNLWDVVVGVVVDVQNNRAYAKNLADPRITPMPRSTDPDTAAGGAAQPQRSPARGRDRSQTTVRVYGNFDLMVLLGIRPEPASLYVHFTLGRHQSNVVRVELVNERGEE